MFHVVKSSLNRLSLSATDELTLNSGCMYQFVRWRKRRIDPVAKSKVGRVRIPTPIDPAEYKFVLSKWPEYNTLVNAIRNHCVQELQIKSKETAAGVSLEEQNRKDEEEWQRLLAWNEEENAKTRQMRETRLAEEARQKEEEKLEALVQMEKEETKWLAELEQLVRKEKEASKSYITLDNLDEAIESALAEEKNYLFGIDKNGKVILPEDTAWTDLRERLEKEDQDEMTEKENVETV